MKTPEIIEFVNDSEHLEDEEFARWQSQDAPCFPAPLCTAIPPKRPDRQVSAATGPSYTEEDKEKVSRAAVASEGVPAPPSIPRRRISRALDAKFKPSLMSPPKRPSRQQSAASPDISALEALDLSIGEEEDEDDEDDDVHVDEQTHQRNQYSFSSTDSPPKAPLRELSADADEVLRCSSPKKPLRQKSVAVPDVALFSDDSASSNSMLDNSANSIPRLLQSQRQPSWVRNWAAQGSQGSTRNGAWDF